MVTATVSVMVLVAGEGAPVAAVGGSGGVSGRARV